MNGNIASAFLFAQQAHDAVGQVRKYTGLPYWTHPWQVAVTLASDLGRFPGGGPDKGYTHEQMIIAAVLHDVVEDTKITNAEIDMAFGPSVAVLVDDLTHRFTKEAFPHLNRAERKAHEAERIKATSKAARCIKTHGLMDNLRDLVDQDPDFALTMAQETMLVYDWLPTTPAKWVLGEILKGIVPDKFTLGARG